MVSWWNGEKCLVSQPTYLSSCQTHLHYFPRLIIKFPIRFPTALRSSVYQPKLEEAYRAFLQHKNSADLRGFLSLTGILTYPGFLSIDDWAQCCGIETEVFKNLVQQCLPFLVFKWKSCSSGPIKLKVNPHLIDFLQRKPKIYEYSTHYSQSLHGTMLR